MTTEEKRVYHRQWAAKNPEKIRAYAHKSYVAGREKRREAVRKWRARNPEKDKAYTKKWRAANRKRVNDSIRAWQKANPEKARLISRRRAYKAKYGITIEQYDEMVRVQNGLCALCKCLPKRKLLVDHDHQTKKVRALLCYRCNNFIGHIESNGVPVLRALAYIARHKRDVR